MNEAQKPGNAAALPASSSAANLPADSPAATVSLASAVETPSTGQYQLDPLPAASAPDGEIFPRAFGRYELRQLLGKGGMGAVYLAHDSQLDRLVAVKMPRFSKAENNVDGERFLREAKTMAGLHHAHICPVYDAGVIGGVLYMSMAYIEGESLAQRLKHEKFSAGAAAELVRTIALAMDEAHHRGVVHRDLKSANIMLDGRGQPVVMDFGLARRLTATDEVSLTQEGLVIGTPSYMAPEQAGDDAIGPACDIYSLAVILYEMLAGRVPFQAETVGKLLAQIQRDAPPPPSRFQPHIDPHLEKVILKALAKRPEDRYETMADFAAALAPFARVQSTDTFSVAPATVAYRSPSRLRRGLLIGVAALFLTVVLGVVFYVATDNGTVEIRINDPKADVQVQVNGNDIIVTQGKAVTRLRVGRHVLEVKGKGFETTAQKFSVTRGQTKVVEVTLKPKNPPPNEPKASPADLEKAADLAAQADKAFARGDLDKAYSLVKRALKLNANSLDGRDILAGIYIYKGRIDDALKETDKILALDKRFAGAYVTRSWAYLEKQNYGGCIDNAKKAIALNPHHPMAHANLAAGYINRKEPKKALVAANKALELNEKLLSGLANRGMAYADLGDFDKAKEDFDAIVEFYPKKYHGYWYRAALYKTMGEEGKSANQRKIAETIEPELKSKPLIRFLAKSNTLTAAQRKHLAALIRSGKELVYTERVDELKPIAEEILRLDPQSPNGLALLAASAGPKRITPKCLADAEKAIRLNPETSMAYLVRGLDFGNKNQIEEAIADFTIFIRLEEKFYLGWNNRARAYLLRKDFHQALADVQEAFKRKPNSKLVLQNRCIVLSCLGQYKKALNDCNAVLGHSEFDVQSLVFRCLLNKKLGHEPEALKDYKLIEKRVGPAKAQTMGLPEPWKAPPATKLAKEQREQIAKWLQQAERATKADPILKATDEILKVDPIHVRALELRANALDRLSKEDEALRVANKAIRIAPDRAYSAYVTRCHIFIGRKEPAKAIADANISIRIHPTRTAYSNRGLGYLMRGNHYQALADLNKALEYKEDSARPGVTYANRADVLLRLGKYKDAAADLERALRIEPTNALWHFGLYALYARLEDAPRSQKHRKLAIQYDGRLKNEIPSLAPPLPPPKLDPE